MSTARTPARRIGSKGFWRAVVLSLVSIPWVAVPLWLLLVNSAKPLSEAGSLSLSLPEKWALGSNYSTVVKEGHYGTALLNSLVVIVPTIAVVVVLGSMSAWAYARSRALPMKAAYSLSVLSILLPPAILPTIYELQALQLDGTRMGYFLVMVGTRMGTVVFLATGFIRSLPPDMEEAASLDGAGKLQIYRMVIFPLIVPVLLVGSVILIISTWNDFFFASFLLQGSDRATLPIALYQFASASSDVAAMRWNLIFAHVVLTSLPLVLMYLAVQRKIVGGLTEGGVKG
ncbi:carbohydrate ABC transporter permease [Streptomyces acidicola]|uniref:carbohydrate ABC transporter permease n=1 Tax=Streptomyces acidicola TaxID=2596892 RepID=UPI0037B088E4